jgi:hypothetical protein
MKSNSGMKLMGTIILGVVSVAIIVGAVYFSTPMPQSGAVSCLFYSAKSKYSLYNVYATLSNNSSYPVSIERVYFDGTEQAYSAVFVADVGGIWSMRVGDQFTNVLGVANVSTLMLTAAVTNPDTAHIVRVVTNESSLEFTVEEKFSSLVFDNYNIFVGPGIDYMIAYVNNIGNASGNIIQVALDGADYMYICNVPPPNSRYQWSMVVGSVPTAFIDVGQQAQVYVNTSGICHACTHILRVACSDGSSVEFSFNPW